MTAVGEVAAAEEKTEFNVKMTSFGGNKIGVIKTIRSITGLGLKEAKDLVESVPSVLRKVLTRKKLKKLRKNLKRQVLRSNLSSWLADTNRRHIQFTSSLRKQKFRE